MFYDTTLIVLQRIHPDFWGFKWVLKATDSNSLQKTLTVIKIQKDLVVGTDGHRLHVYYTREEHPPGIFKLLIGQRFKLILEKVTDVKFPEWESLFSATETEKELALTRIDSQGYTQLIRQMEENKTLEFNYFMDLDSSMTKVSIAIDKDRILFEDVDGSKKALIMPMHM